MDAVVDEFRAPLPEGVLCYQCQYNLVGRVRGEVCPECGLDAAASWPVWDLSRCHRVYLEHVEKEVKYLLGWSTSLASATLLVALASALATVPWKRWQGDLQVNLAIMLYLVSFVSIILALKESSLLAKKLRTHPNRDRAPGGSFATSLSYGAMVSAGGFAILYPIGLIVAGLVFTNTVSIGIVLATIGLALWLIGLVVVSLAGLAYVGQVLVRAGLPDRRFLVEEAPVVLAFLSPVLAVLGLLGLLSWFWVACLVSLCVALGAGGVALRCWRAGRALRGLLLGPSLGK